MFSTSLPITHVSSIDEEQQMETVQKTCSRQCRQRESALGIFVKLLSKPLFCTFNRGETIVTIPGCASDLPSFDNVHWQFQRGPAAEEHPEIGHRRHNNGTPFQNAYHTSDERTFDGTSPL